MVQPGGPSSNGKSAIYAYMGAKIGKWKNGNLVGQLADEVIGAKNRLVIQSASQPASMSVNQPSSHPAGQQSSQPSNQEVRQSPRQSLSLPVSPSVS